MGEVRFSKDHIWVRQEGELVALGITDRLCVKLGDVVFLTMPEPGEELEAGLGFGDVEGVKTVVTLTSPVTGQVAEVNRKAMEEPETVGLEPFETWLLKVKAPMPSDVMDAARYYESL